MSSDQSLSYFLNILDEIVEKFSYKMLCELTTEQEVIYRDLLKKFKSVNSISVKDPNCPDNINELKGKALEDITGYLLKISGDIFKLDRNLITNTNEIDDLVKLNKKGAILTSRNLINSKLFSFIGECKNYNKKVDVTYVGKFCSLLLTNQTSLGIIFSYYGVTGRNWNDASGLIKKFYLHKEKVEDRYCIIDFNYNDFESILNGKNLLQIIDDRLTSLQYDTDYERFISKHPAEDDQ